MGNSRIDKIRQMSRNIKMENKGRRNIPYGMLIMAAAGVWALVRLIMSILYFF